MAKRFTDTDKWKDEWYLSLSNDNRIIWQYLLDGCSHAGIMKKNFRLLNFCCNTSVTENDILKVFAGRVIDCIEYFFIPKFLKFQYPNGLKSEKPVIVSIRKELIEKGLLDNDCNIIIKPLDNGLATVKDKDKDKDMVKDKDKDFGKSENLLKILVPEMVKTFKKFNTSYPADVERDSKPLQQIAKFISDAQKIPYNPRDHTCKDHILSSWEVISEFISKDNFFKSYNLILIEKHIQSIVQKIVHGQSTGTNGKAGTGKVTGEQLNQAFTKFYSSAKSS